ncbi:MAG TPA: LytTR family DNA-binding domain-containing protein [Pyrinomonadaceae bacterium]|nr:LytTR family DNA-binding domain-containing protein [Pyrinomonadaceae bacterium]
MSKIKALIVDDEPLARDRIRELLKDHPDVEVIAQARNGREAIDSVANYNPDLVFLDIQMPDLDGFDVLQNLDVAQLPVIIFVTAYDQHALRAFDVHAVDYLTKPFDRERFAKAVEQAKVFMKGTKEPDTARILSMLQELRAGARYLERFAIKNGETVFFVRAEEVDAIEAQGNYVRLSLANSSHLLRDTLNNVESQINPRMFIRIHRRTIVNIDRIKEVQTWARGEYRVVLSTGAHYTLSRGYRQHFEKFIRLGS